MRQTMMCMMQRAACMTTGNDWCGQAGAPTASRMSVVWRNLGRCNPFEVEWLQWPIASSGLDDASIVLARAGYEMSHIYQCLVVVDDHIGSDGKRKGVLDARQDSQDGEFARS